MIKQKDIDALNQQMVPSQDVIRDLEQKIQNNNRKVDYSFFNQKLIWVLTVLVLMFIIPFGYSKLMESLVERNTPVVVDPIPIEENPVSEVDEIVPVAEERPIDENVRTLANLVEESSGIKLLLPTQDISLKGELDKTEELLNESTYVLIFYKDDVEIERIVLNTAVDDQTPISDVALIVDQISFEYNGSNYSVKELKELIDLGG